MRKTNDKKALEALNTSLNVDYTNLFIKRVEFTDKTNGESNVIDASEYTVNELLEVISVFPQDVLYADSGIIQYITREFITKINDTFDKHKCALCGAVVDATADSSADGFF